MNRNSFIFGNYVCGSLVYGCARNIIYKAHIKNDDKKDKLYIDRTISTILNIVMHPYIAPYAIYEDLSNIERTIRNLPLPDYNTTKIFN